MQKLTNTRRRLRSLIEEAAWLSCDAEMGELDDLEEWKRREIRASFEITQQGLEAAIYQLDHIHEEIFRTTNPDDDEED